MKKKKIHTFLIGLILLPILFFALILVLVFLGISDLPLGQTVGVIPIRGTLVADSTESMLGYSVGTREIIAQIEAADENPSVSVILLDINSGGGSVVAGKELERAIQRTEKPVVAYIGEVGASSAYLIASAADEIVADEDSLTGSIGAVAVVENYVGLMKKIGVNMTVIKGGKNKAMLNPYENFTEEQKQLFQELVDDAYQDFKTKVVANRQGRLSEERFDEIADGRVLNGRQALALGLIDHTGSRKLALQRAAVLGGLEGEPPEKIFYPTRSAFDGIFGEMGFYFGQGLIQGIQQNQVKLEA